MKSEEANEEEPVVVQVPVDGTHEEDKDMVEQEAGAGDNVKHTTEFFVKVGIDRYEIPTLSRHVVPGDNHKPARKQSFFRRRQSKGIQHPQEIPLTSDMAKFVYYPHSTHTIAGMSEMDSLTPHSSGSTAASESANNRTAVFTNGRSNNVVLAEEEFCLRPRNDGESGGENDELEVRPLCGYQGCSQMRYRNLVVGSLVSLSIVTVILLIVPSTILTHDALSNVTSLCQQSSQTLTSEYNNLVENMTVAMGFVGGSNLFKQLLNDVLDQPPHCANSMQNGMQFLYNNNLLNGYPVNSTLGQYNAILNANISESQLDVKLWNTSIAPLISSITRTGLYNQTAKGFATFAEQYIDVIFARDAHSVIVGGRTRVATYNRTSNSFVGYSYNLSLSTFLPNGNELGTPIDNMYYLNHSDFQPYQQQLQFKEEGRGTNLIGSWSNITLFRDPIYMLNMFGYSFTWPWTPCGSYDCLTGVFGGVITSLDLSRFCNYLINVMVIAIPQVEDWVYNSGLLYYSKDPDQLPQLQLNETVAATMTNPPSAQLVNSTIAFLIGTSNGDNGREIASSKYENQVITNSSAEGILPPLAVDSDELTIAGVSGFLLDNYGPFSVNNPNYQEPMVIFVTYDTFVPCAMDASVENCLVVTTSLVSTSNITYFPAANGVSFLAISVVPYYFMMSDLPKVVDQVAFTTSTNNLLAQATIENAKNLEIGIGVFSFIITVILAVLISITVSRPLEQLTRSMSKLRDLEFVISSEERRYASRVWEVRVLQETFRALKSTLKVIEKFIPRSVVGQIVRNENNARHIKVVGRKVTILFSDIQGFTTITEALQPPELLTFITNYLTIMTKIVEEYEGSIAEIQGDGVLAFWNTPDYVDNHAAKACASALAQHEALTVLRQKFDPLMKKYGLGPISIRIGINTGHVLTGNIGSLSKMKFGCMGDPINLASRLEGICKLYGVGLICSEDTFDLLPRDTFLCRKLDLIQAKGKTKGTVIYQVIAQDAPFHQTKKAKILRPGQRGRDERTMDVYVRSEYKPSSVLISDQQRASFLHYETALALYQSAQFHAAKEELARIPEIDQDRPCQFLESRILEHLEAQANNTFDLETFNHGQLNLASKEF